MKFEPFTLILEMGTPFCMPDNAIHLDALVAYCVGSRWDISAADGVEEKIKEFIEFDEEYGVFKASAMTMLVTEDIGVTTGGIHRPDNLRNKMTSDLFQHKKSIVLNGGPTKRRYTRRGTYFCPFVKFSGVGDSGAISKLLENHLPGIGSDARTSGGGEIIGIRALKEESFEYLKGDLPTRNIPASLNIKIESKEVPYPVRLRPPYMTSKEVNGFKAERVCVELF